MRRVACGLALLAAGPAAALEVMPRRYTCERGVEIPAVYANADDGTAVVLLVENAQITLLREPSGSGERYAWPSDGSEYVWLTKGDEAMLLWRDGAADTETALLRTCRAE